MSFPIYDNYIDSENPFLGKLPSHWTLRRLSTVCYFESGKAHEPFVDEDGDFICVNSRFVSTQGEAEKRCTKNLSPTNQDDILMVMSDLPNGRALARAFYVADNRPYAVNQRVCIVRALEAVPRYVFYYLDRNPQFLWYDDGFNQTHLSNSTFTKFPLVLPPLPEQRSIAAFLDAETSKIDALVAEQRRLIELLKEKRQAVISHAVTKGLNPHVKMKPCGIDWLGDVPEHWEVQPIYARYEQVLGKMLDQAKQSGINSMPYLRNIDVQWDFINISDLPLIDIRESEIERFTVKKGDLLICEGGEVGRSAIWCGEDHKFAFQKAIHRLRPLTQNENPRYLFYVMKFASDKGAFLANSNPNTIPHLTGEQLRLYRFPKPPISEQEAIVKALDKSCVEFSSLLNESEKAISLLQERRTALISAAVTGKIDVRGFVRKEAFA